MPKGRRSRNVPLSEPARAALARRGSGAEFVGDEDYRPEDLERLNRAFGVGRVTEPVAHPAGIGERAIFRSSSTASRSR